LADFGGVQDAVAVNISAAVYSHSTFTAAVSGRL
jgi:hypothetical protein